MRAPILLPLVFLLAGTAPGTGGSARSGPAAAADEQFLKRTYRSGKGETMPYRLFVPPGYDPAKKYPLVLWLHGAAGRGDDNLLQITGGDAWGTHYWIAPEAQRKFPAFVLAPQCPLDKFWGRPRGGEPPPALRLALKVLDKVEKEYSIDADRVYVAGQSMGGEGTWSALLYWPERFAAGIPLCGYLDIEEAPRVARTPVWVFQGAEDAVVPVTWARAFVAALKGAGAAPRYSEYPGVGHPVWEKAFSGPDVADWLASQRREKKN